MKAIEYARKSSSRGSKSIERDPLFTATGQEIARIQADRNASKGALWKAICRGIHTAMEREPNVNPQRIAKGIGVEVKAAGGNPASVGSYLSTIKNAVGSVRFTIENDSESGEPVCKFGNTGQPLTVADLANPPAPFAYASLRNAMQSDEDKERKVSVSGFASILNGMTLEGLRSFLDDQGLVYSVESSSLERVGETSEAEGEEETDQERVAA